MKKLFLALSLFALCTMYTAADNQQRILPLNSPVYEYLEALCLEGGMAIPSTSRPFSIAEAEAYLERIPLSSLSPGGRRTVQEVKKLLSERSLYSEGENFQFNPVLNCNIEAYVNSADSADEWEYGYEQRQPLVELPLQIFLYDAFYADLQPCFQKDPFVAESADTWSNIITDFSEVEGHFPFRGFFSLGGTHWTIQAGRDFLSWGNGITGNLILSDYADYHDFLRFAVFWKTFKFSTCFIEFDSWEDDSVTADDFSESFLGHRLEARFWDRISIALTESLMLESKYFQPRYLNPFMVYHNWFLNDRYGNINLGIELEVNPFRWFYLYGQFCADQIQSSYEKKRYANADSMPDAYGYILGIRGAYPVKTGYVQSHFEWVRTDPWFYLIEGQPDYIVERRIITNYLGKKVIISKPLGYWAGPDTMLFSWQASFSALNLFSLFVGAQYQVQGENTIYTPFESGEAAVSLKTPTGQFPQKKWVLSFGGEWNTWKYLTLGTEFYWVMINNYNHSDGEKFRDFQWIPRISVSLQR